MSRPVLLMVGGVLVVLGVIGVVNLVIAGSCGCDPNSVCAVPPCPSSDGLWFALTFIGFFGAPFVLTAAGFVERNARLRRYQSAQGPVSAELQPASLNASYAPLSRSTPLPATSAPSSSGGEQSRITQLEQLAELRRSGAITQEEFDQEKGRILGS